MLRRASWSLVDQGVVSAGTFAFNVLLARHLTGGEYGIFVLLYSGMLAMQLLNATLVFYPMSVRWPVVERAVHGRLLRASVLLVLTLSMAQSAVLALGLAICGRGELIVAVLCCYMSWQLQEALRRGLLSQFRHGSAIPGDTLSYLGKAATMAVLGLTQSLELGTALYAMAATSLLAAAVQALQLGMPLRGPMRLRKTIAEYWQVAGLWSLGTGLLTQLRIQGLPWILAYCAGPVAVAGFQAASNVVNFANPIMIGLTNIVPQVAAEARHRNDGSAWRVTWGYALFVAPVLVGFSLAIFAAPESVLAILYGAHSEYLHLSVPLRLLIVGGLLSYPAEVIVAYLHGVSAARLGFLVNSAGALVVVALAWPLIRVAGLTGGCATVLAVSLIRLLLARVMLARTSEDSARPARTTSPTPTLAIVEAHP